MTFLIYIAFIPFQAGGAMFSRKFAKFIEIWQKDFAIERSMDKKISLDRDGNPLPWYTYPAIEYLSELDYRQKKIFEFGCGNSSAFWAQRALKVTSIEDNPKWFAKWQQDFKQNNLDIRLREEAAAYQNAIAEDNELYDVIIIDGKYRKECAISAIKYLAPNGMIILDDSDRITNSADYAAAIQILQNADLIQIDFHGFCPMNCYTKTTSLFLRRQFDFKPLSARQPSCGLGNLWSMSRKQRKTFYKDFA